MKVMLRTREPSKRQEEYFGEDAWRPFAIMRNVDSEEEIWYILKKLLRGDEVLNARLFFEPSNDFEIEYSTVESGRITRWNKLGD